MDSEHLEGWKEVRLADAMSAIIDYRGKTPKKVSNGIPLITAKVVKGGRVLEPTEFVSPDEYSAWMRRGMPQAGDVLLTSEAPLGEVGKLESAQVALAQRLFTLRAKPNLLDQGFLYYLMQSPEVQHRLHQRGSGTTVQGIRSSELKEVRLPIPSLQTQRAIRGVLEPIDERLAVNRATNRVIEDLFSGLFRSWFLDFEPVSSRLEQRRLYGVSEATAPLFPSDFDGDCPQGWSQSNLGSLATNPKHQVRPGEVAPDLAYFGLEHLPRRQIALDDWGTAEKVSSAKYRFEKGSILFGKLRPYFHKVGIAPVAGICSTDILVVAPRRKELFPFVLGHCASVEFIDYVDAASGGTKMPRTDWHTMGSFPVCVPPEALLASFNAVVEPLLQRLSLNTLQVRFLENLRASLLVALMNGDLPAMTADRQPEVTLA